MSTRYLAPTGATIVGFAWDEPRVAGSPIALDAAGGRWLPHHLTFNDPKNDIPPAPMMAATCALFRREVAIGEAWEAAKHATAAVERARAAVPAVKGEWDITDTVLDNVRTSEGMVARAYAAAKRASLHAARSAS